ncbi:MAG: DNA topology modulation protein [Acidobacteria bacterium]|nr:DNA topology modulation protein [Acidobacteriota bacterium]MCA1638286.1 DNA topology modulation protein [Acidobacteriota bacterium]
MKRILIIGSGGAGKSTFAKQLGEATDIEVLHLDKLHWKPGWIEPTKDEWRKTVAEIVAEDSWIIDGNYGGTMQMRIERCDMVIFLDLPRIVCVWRVLKRFLTYRNGTRPDMAEGCNEKLDWKFLEWIWHYPIQTKPKVESLLKRFQNTKTIIRLQSKKEVERFLQNI